MRIRFANDYTTPGGRTYKAGTEAEITDTGLARSLIFRGKAVEAETPPAEQPADSAAAETPKTRKGTQGKE
jgi:hypothetical protein